MSIKGADRERLIHINFIMNQLHDHTNSIYEHLVDKEYKEVREEVSSLTAILNNLTASINSDGRT